MSALALLAPAEEPPSVDGSADGADRPAAADDVLAGCPLFAGLSVEQMDRVAALIALRRFEPGDVLVREGDAASELFVIQKDMAGVLSMDALERLGAADRDLERKILRNLTNELSRRLRLTKAATATAMEQQLELERTRALMGRMFVFMVFLMVTYAAVLTVVTRALPPGTSASAITIPISFAWGVALYALMRHSHLPFAVFGLTLRGWRPVVREALVWTAMICVGTTILKLVLIGTSGAFAHERLFNLTGLLDPNPSSAHLRTSLAIGIVYAAVGPLQEFIARSGLQTALRRCLVGRWATIVSIVASNAMFACAHLHLSVGFAIIAFFPGLLWGALFHRQRHIVGVSVSHVLCGWFAFFIVGFEPWY